MATITRIMLQFSQPTNRLKTSKSIVYFHELYFYKTISCNVYSTQRIRPRAIICRYLQICTLVKYVSIRLLVQKHCQSPCNTLRLCKAPNVKTFHPINRKHVKPCCKHQVYRPMHAKCKAYDKKFRQVYFASNCQVPQTHQEK